MEKHLPNKLDHILIIEPFYGGSHKQLITTLLDGLTEHDREGVCLITLTPKKWHWRARTSALYIAGIIPRQHNFKVLLASSVLNLTELTALRHDLIPLKKIVYFHENQLVYPVQNERERDFQYGYNQVLTCLVADIVVFNSVFNKHSFLNAIKSFFKLQPDYRPKNLEEMILPKCQVLYFPVKFPPHKSYSKEDDTLHVVWPHRWEHDKDPEFLFRVLYSLFNAGNKFHISILGESFSTVPSVFEEAATYLKSCILNWGYLQSKEDYYNVLRQAHVVISTAKHEFYGVSMLEAVHCGCYPLCPDALVYPEIYPSECLFKSEQHLLNTLMEFCSNPSLVKEMRNNLKLDMSKYSHEQLLQKYKQLLHVGTRR